MAIRFDHVTSVSSHLTNILENNWFDSNETISLDSKSFVSHEYIVNEYDKDMKRFKKLKYSDLFKYKTQLDEQQQQQQQQQQEQNEQISFTSSNTMTALLY